LKDRNEKRMEQVLREGKLEVLFNSRPVEILPAAVKLDVAGEPRTIDNDYVWVFAGGIPPNDFLKKIGVAFGVQDVTADAHKEAHMAVLAGRLKGAIGSSMNKRFMQITGLAVTIVAGGGVLWFSRQSPNTARTTAPATAVIPSSAAHEIASLEDELKKKPGHSPILVRLAELHQEAGRPGEAVRYLKQVLAAEPSNFQERLELGKALYETGDVDGALAETKKILEFDPKNVDALYNLGAIYGNQNNLVEARNYFAKAVAADASSDSGQKARAAMAQLETSTAPMAGGAVPAGGAGPLPPGATMPPGHPPIAASNSAVIDRLMETAQQTKNQP
jgi:cytochrome c-type biogenesis protein CcmH/NrfG